MRTKAKMIWDRMTPRQQERARVYYCNLEYQVHHCCEHGGHDFDFAQVAELIHVHTYART